MSDSTAEAARPLPPVLYGIPNCDKVRNARHWLNDVGQPYHFRDFRREPLSEDTLQTWFQAYGADAILNPRSAAWKKLDPAQAEAIRQGRQLALVSAEPTLIRRPVLEYDGKCCFGFDPRAYKAILDANPGP